LGLSIKDRVFGDYRETEELSQNPNNGLFGLAFKDIAQMGRPVLFETRFNLEE